MEKFDLAKLLQGFNVTKGVNVGKIMHIVIIVAVCLGIFYKTFIAKTIDQQQDQKVTITDSKIKSLNLGQSKEDSSKYSVGAFGGVHGSNGFIGMYGSMKF